MVLHSSHLIMKKLKICTRLGLTHQNKATGILSQIFGWIAVLTTVRFTAALSYLGVRINDLHLPLAYLWSMRILSVQKLRRIQPAALPSPPENIAQAMRNAAKRDDSVDELCNVPDNVICAAFWTILLVYNLVCWPFCLMTLIWWKINPQDFSDFRGV